MGMGHVDWVAAARVWTLRFLDGGEMGRGDG